MRRPKSISLKESTTHKRKNLETLCQHCHEQEHGYKISPKTFVTTHRTSRKKVSLKQVKGTRPYKILT